MPLNNPSEFILSSKVKIQSRTGAAGTGDVSYTGYGFKPKALIALSGEGNKVKSSGLADEELHSVCVRQVGGQDNLTVSSINLINMDFDGSNKQTAVLKSLDDDGFTLTWTKGGDGCGFDFIVLALR